MEGNIADPGYRTETVSMVFSGVIFEHVNAADAITAIYPSLLPEGTPALHAFCVPAGISPYVRYDWISKKSEQASAVSQKK